LQTNYIGRAYDKEQSGDLDGAIQDLNQAIEHQPARRDEACEHLARVKEKRGDWAGALAAYDRLVSFDPNKAGSYWVRATAKEQHGDFEGAMADFTRAAELRSSGANFIEIGNRRKAHGDLTGATATYDKAIAMLDSQIAGTTKPSDRLDLLFYQRGYAKELKGDIDGAVADYGRAIATKPSYEAGAYSRRGDIKKARGDLAGAVADYQYAVKYAQLPEDKEKLRRAQAEASQKHERSFNKSEVTPESIAEAFVQAYSGADVDGVASLYADRVDYTNSGVISNAAVRAQAKEYFARWPVRQWSLVGAVQTTSMGPSRQKVIFSASYDASNPETNKHASGIATETLIVATDASGAMKIVSQKEQTSTRGSSQPGEKTSGDPSLKAAKTEYDTSSHDEAARVRYVTKLAGMLGQGMEYWWRTHDRMGGPNLDGVEEELIKHPAPGNADSKELSRLLVGKWLSPRHVYVFRADGTYGLVDTDERIKWRINGNEYLDDVARGTIILIDHKYFVYAEGQGVAFYMRENDSEAERNQSAGTNTQNTAAEVTSTSNDNGDRPSDSAIKQKLLGYWKSPRHGYLIKSDGIMYMLPRKYATTTNRWDVRGGRFYQDGAACEIVTLTDKKFVYRDSRGTYTLIRGSKEEIDPE